MTEDARSAYVALVRAIGGGFHPDTRGEAYASLPDGLTPEDVDAVVDRAHDAGLDVYGLALDLIHAEDTRASSAPIGLEARCLTCGETFNPADESDTIHLARADGTDCGGLGEIVGEWR